MEQRLADPSDGFGKGLPMSRFHVVVVSLLALLVLAVAGVLLFASAQMTPWSKQADIALMIIRDQYQRDADRPAKGHNERPACFFQIRGFAGCKDVSWFAGSAAGRQEDADMFLAYHCGFDAQKKDWIAMIAKEPVERSSSARVLWNNGQIARERDPQKLFHDAGDVKYYYHASRSP